VSEEAGDAFEDVPFAGILGLGFPKLAAENTVPPFDQMMANHKLQNDIFSVFMTEDGNKEGAIMFGKVD